MLSPLDVLEQWMAATNSGNVDAIHALYAENAVLIPTFSANCLNTPEKIRGYFTRLGERENLSVALHSKTVHQQDLGNHIHVLSGIYCWRFDVDEETLNFEARFNYVIDCSKERPIQQHHSSQVPRGL